MATPESDPQKETFLIHDISPQLERKLIRQARAKGHDASTEAADIIEKHVEEEGGDTA